MRIFPAFLSISLGHRILFAVFQASSRPKCDPLSFACGHFTSAAQNWSELFSALAAHVSVSASFAISVEIKYFLQKLWRYILLKHFRAAGSGKKFFFRCCCFIHQQLLVTAVCRIFLDFFGRRPTA